MNLPILKITFGYIVIALITLGPLLIALLSGVIGNFLGCTVSEVGPQECIALGIDIGWLLYAMGAIGWLFLVTVPLGVLLTVIWTTMFIVMLIRKNS